MRQEREVRIYHFAARPDHIPSTRKYCSVRESIKPKQCPLFSSRLTKYRTVAEGSCGQCARTCSLCCTPGLAEGPCRDRCTRRCPCAQNECGSRWSNLPHTVCFRLLILVRTCGLYSHILRHGCSEPPCMTNAGEIQAKVLLHHTPPRVNSRPGIDITGF